MFTHSASLYLASVLIWGSTWYAIKFQLGVVAPEVSLLYRFALAALILLAFCALTRRSLRYSLSQHGFIAMQGLFLFSSNYLNFLLGNRITDLGYCRADVFYGNTDEHHQRRATRRQGFP
jgi:drug/metabolite transporter (DMT)-like permease